MRYHYSFIDMVENIGFAYADCSSHIGIEVNTGKGSSEVIPKCDVM